jgi:hypothetical protein
LRLAWLAGRAPDWAKLLRRRAFAGATAMLPASDEVEDAASRAGFRVDTRMMVYALELGSRPPGRGRQGVVGSAR